MPFIVAESPLILRLLPGSHGAARIAEPKQHSPSGEPGTMRHILANSLQRGLSLIELLVTMSIAVILLTIGVPSFIDMMAANTASSYANDLLADLNYARSEAITRGSRVVVCKGMSGVNCSAGSWSDGWRVFEDCDGVDTPPKMEAGKCPDRDGNGGADDEIPLRVHAALSNGWTLNANNFSNFISFWPDGRANTNGTFVFCKDGAIKSGNQSRSSAITINRTGRARTLQDTDNDGAPNDDNGNLLAARCTTG
ncbi:MAG: GspH/FimT family pseudopilin [Gallionellaceae bacterium]|nr:GspH/FimT family pseudopilin [Gallionellaceae bacterium]